ncbi:MAG: GNAT family N-acetyltransferase [Clostridia bacterium]|nr:GNAT family N-acetyltransferase [Clostridia bacterium]
MIRKASRQDLDGIVSILKSIGHAVKDPAQGFLMADYTKDEALYRQKYAQDLSLSPYAYVYDNNDKIEAFLLAYPLEYWLKKEPDWLEAVYWHPQFDKDLLKTSVLIYQTAMYPQLTGKGIGSQIYQQLLPDLQQNGITTMLAETVIAPIPNLASLNFRIKQKYDLAGMRYETFENTVYTTLVYSKDLTAYNMR